MRPIVTPNDLEQAENLSLYLKSLGIGNQLEVTKNTNWGDVNYSDISYKIWIYNEDHIEQAKSIAEEFSKSPYSEKFKISLPSSKVNPLKNILEAPKPDALKRNRPASFPAAARTPMGPVTLYLLIGCTLLFLLTELTTKHPSGNEGANLGAIPSFYSPIKKHMLFDYPQAFEIIDQLVENFGTDVLFEAKAQPKGALLLIDQFAAAPYWKGMYDKVISYFQPGDRPFTFNAPLFEKIRQGQWWRLFTPSLLHADLFHLLFNMIWLSVLGRQMELRMGKWKYVLFMLIAALITNTAQYFMSGWSFLGFSGVLCAMLSFVWMRQRRSAWEGYFLQPSTMTFISLFLGLMLLFQVASFASEILFGVNIAPPIANTAHMTGLVLGLLFGSLNFFKSA